MKKTTVKINENMLLKIVSESVKKILSESAFDGHDYDDDYEEDYPLYDVIEYIRHGVNDEVIHEVLSGIVYDKNDNPVGKLNDLHFKYTPKNGRNGGFR
jgi:hypothetical protein